MNAAFHLGWTLCTVGPFSFREPSLWFGSLSFCPTLYPTHLNNPSIQPKFNLYFHFEFIITAPPLVSPHLRLKISSLTRRHFSYVTSIDPHVPFLLLPCCLTARVTHSSLLSVLFSSPSHQYLLCVFILVLQFCTPCFPSLTHGGDCL